MSMADPLAGIEVPITDKMAAPPPEPVVTYAPPVSFPTPEPQPEVSFGELFGNAALNETSVGNVIGKFSNMLDDEEQLAGIDIDPTYDPLDDPQTVGYGEFAFDYLDSRSPKQTSLILKRIDQRIKDREMLAAAGWEGFGALIAAGALDPLNAIPIFSAARAPTMLRAAGEAAALGVGTSTINETLARIHQGSARPLEESLVNISADALLMGAFGSGAHWLGKAFEPSEELGNALKEEFTKAVRAEDPSINPQAAGAQASPYSASIRENTPVSSLGVGELQANNSPVGNPASRTVRSPLNASRNASRELAENAELFAGEAGERAAPQAAETLYRVKWESRMHRSIGAMDDLFLEYRGLAGKFAGALRAGIKDTASMVGATSAPAMTKTQFKEAISHALRNNDLHEVPQVQKAAQIYRREIIEPLKKEAIELELLDPDVKAIGSATYLTRIYNTVEIARKRGEFAGILKEYFARDREAERGRDPTEVNHWRTTSARAKENMERIQPLLAEKKKEHKEASKIVKATEKLFGALIAVEKNFKRQFERFDVEHEAAQTRAERMRPTGKLPEDDPFVQRLSDARALANGRLKEPQRISERVRDAGGIIDRDGLLASRGLKTVRYRRGVIATDPRQGMTMDDALRGLAGEGWVSAKYNPNTQMFDDLELDDLIEALELDVAHHGGKSDTPVYNMVRDGDEVFRYTEAKEMTELVDEAGANFSMSNEEIAYRMEVIPEYKSSTPVTRTASRGADYYMRRVRENMERAQKEYLAAKEKLNAKSAKNMSARAAAQKAVADYIDLRSEYRASKRLYTNYNNRFTRHVEVAGIPDGELDKIVDDVINNILANNGRGMYTPVSLMGRSLRERTLGIDDNLIKKFLENDIERVIRSHTRQMGADIEITRKFGSPDMSEVIDDIKDEFNLMIEELPDAVRKANKKLKPEALQKKIEQESARLNKQLKDDIRDIEAMRDRLTGRRFMPTDPNGLMHRAGIFARNFNLLRLGGGFALASVPDIGSIALSHGMARVLGRKGFLSIITASRLAKLNMRETQLLGTALDLILDTRAHNLADVVDDYGRNSAFERGVQFAADKYGIVNGMSIWNQFMKQWAGTVSITRNLEAIEAYTKGTISQAERRRLHWLGIDKEAAERIHKLASKHGETDGKIRWPNVQKWLNEDGTAADAERTIFGAAIVKDVDTAIVTPGIGDKPLWLDAPATRLIGQFRSFFLSSSVRITTRGLQQRDANVAQGAVLMTLLGALAYRLKTPDDKISEDPAVWMKEAIDRSGLMGWFMEANNMTEKFTGNAVGLSALLGTKPSQRYASRGFLGNLLGPTAGLVDEAAGFSAAASSGEWTEKDTERALNMIPMYKTFYLRWMRDMFKDDVDPNEDGYR